MNGMGREELASAKIDPSSWRLLHWPVFAQLSDPLPDGYEDPYSTSDCGEECVSMAVAGLRHVWFSAGCLRQALGSRTVTGITHASDLTYLLDAFKIAHSIAVEPTRSTLQDVRESVRSGHGCIILGDWERFGVGHWMLAVGCKDLGLWVNDPWLGKRRHLTAAEYATSSYGVTVKIEETA